MGKGGQIQVQVAWFYRPEEAMGGRKVTPMHMQSRSLHVRTALWQGLLLGSQETHASHRSILLHTSTSSWNAQAVH